jgi:inositol-phosphate transport system permease protein
MIPAGIIVLLFFLIPVFLTVVFSFTTMGSETGITGNRYVISEVSLRKLKDSGLRPAIVEKLVSSFFMFI